MILFTLDDKESPVLNLQGLPDVGSVIDSIADELSLFAQLEVDILLVIFTLDVRNVDGDEDISLVFFEAQEGHDDGSEVGSG